MTGSHAEGKKTMNKQIIMLVAAVLIRKDNPLGRVSVNESVMFPSGPFDFFYAPHNRVASTVMHMTVSLTDLYGYFIPLNAA